jgi:predicted PurR-regulated permease PerM
MTTPSLFKQPTQGAIVSGGCVLALLYFGRPVLEPLVLALILSMVIGPLIRGIGSRLGLGHAASTTVALLLVGAGLAAMTATLALQLVSLTHELPQYRSAIQAKMATVQNLSERPFARLSSSIGAADAIPENAAAGLGAAGVRPIPVEVRTPAPSTRDTLAHLVSLVSGPVGEAGLVFVLMVFIVLEHESLRDRIIHLAGPGDVGGTMRALMHAAQGVSGFFASQLVVNIGFALMVSIALWLANVPHALLWGSLSGLLRFVPYVGALLAGGAIVLFVAAIDPGWNLALCCLGAFLLMELVVANVIEPRVYGHSSGLSPLAVMVSALFWGSLWGPAGLLIATPLTLCLVVAGRHVRALEAITTLCADTPTVTQAQRFYHRVLAGETDAVTQHATAYLRKNSFSRYCDFILVPGLELAVADQERGRVDQVQQDSIRATVIALADTLMLVARGAPKSAWRRRKGSLIDVNFGAHLREARIAKLGRWQGPLDVPLRSIVLCAGMSSERDEFLGELLVLALRERGTDARSVALDQPLQSPEPASGELVSTVFIVYPIASAMPAWEAAVAELRAGLPGATLVTIRLRSDDAMPLHAEVQARVDIVLRSFEEGAALVAPASDAARGAA